MESWSGTFETPASGFSLSSSPNRGLEPRSVTGSSRTISQKVEVSASVHFRNAADEERWDQTAKFREPVVCQIHTPAGGGSGFLIGSNLLMTCNHVLPTIEVAKMSTVRFFRSISEDPYAETRQVSVEEIALKPDYFFHTSAVNVVGNKVGPAAEGKLDFTVVALQPHPLLSDLEKSAFSIFDLASAQEGTPICVLHHPMDIALNEDLRRSYGILREHSSHSQDYDALTEGGSSGGPVMDANGKLIALHQLSNQEDSEETVQAKFSTGTSALKIAEALASEKPRLERTEANLSRLSKLEAALTSLKDELNICWLSLGENHLKTADTYHRLGITLHELGRHDKALTPFQQALGIHKQRLGNDDLTTAESHRHMGITMSKLGSHEEALAHHKRALEIRKQVLGDDHPDTADSYRNVGIALGYLGRYEEALTYALCALEIRRQKFVDDHLTTADSYYWVGSTLSRLGRPLEAAVSLQRANEIRTSKS